MSHSRQPNANHPSPAATSHSRQPNRNHPSPAATSHSRQPNPDHPSPAAMSHNSGCGVRRVVKPQPRYIPSIEEHEEAWSRLLSKVEAFYREASKRLVVSARPVTLARLLDSGLCIGLLDPVSNIIANTLCTSNLRPEIALVGTIVSKKFNEECGCLVESYCPDLREKVMADTVVTEKICELGRRSLEGITAFLISFFPYIAEWEARRYLLLANADLLAAAFLIMADRGMTELSLTSPVGALAFKDAFALAAQVGKHSQPNLLAQLWMSLSSDLNLVMTMLLKVQPHSPRWNLEAFKTLHKRNRASADLSVPWSMAIFRLLCSNSIPTSMPYEHTRSLRMVLLDTIHSYYLKALALLPSNELRSRLHRSLLKAGHCYGPMDPVSNIILNTIWYDVNFPAAADTVPVLDVIGPNSLTRLVSRSFYGLLSFLQTRYHDLSEHQIVRCLVAASAQLSIADPKLKFSCDEDYFKQQHYRRCVEGKPDLFSDAIRKMEEARPCAELLEAYAAAATAAWHRHPEEQAKFLASWDKKDFAMCLIELTDVQSWSVLLSEAEQRAPERVCNPSHRARNGKARSMNMQRRISKKVKAALDWYQLQDGKPTLDLHIICCVNENVCGPEYCANDDCLAFAPCKYRYSHVNFMAIERNCESDATMRPRLFFAEFDNEEEDGAPLVMCRVDPPIPFAEHLRCLYCELEGARVVHPAMERFHGGGSELSEVICGERDFNNDRLISMNEYYARRMCGVEEDFMYVDVKNNE